MRLSILDLCAKSFEKGSVLSQKPAQFVHLGAAQAVFDSVLGYAGFAFLRAGAGRFFPGFRFAAVFSLFPAAFFTPTLCFYFQNFESFFLFDVF